MEILRIKPSPKQYEAYKCLLDHITRYILFGGAANSGKSWLLCEWLLGNCISYPQTRWLLARKELKQLKLTTLATFFKVSRFYGIIPKKNYNYNAQMSTITFPNESEIVLTELKHQPSDPDFDDLGSLELTGAAIDEISEINFKAFDVLKGRVGRQYNEKYNILPKILMTCNPSKNWSYRTFYKPSLDNSLPEDHKFIKALVQDNIYREAGSLEALQQTTGATHQRLFLGNWEYDDDPAKLIDYDTILNMFTNQFVKKGLNYITADIARFGDNKTVICIWEGWRCFKIITIDKGKITEAAEIIREYANKYKIPTSRIIVDEDGIGGGVVDILKCKGFVNNSKPKTTNKKENYLNLKSQCYFKYAEKVNNNEVYIICDDEEIKEKIIEEHEYIKKDKIDKDGKVCILPKDKVKEQLGRSPDYSDAMMMRLWFDIGFQFSIK